MNPEKFYQNYREEAFCELLTKRPYTTFVAMPFKERYSYNYNDIFNNVICKAVEKLNEELKDKSFEIPETVEDSSKTAITITDEIIEKIMKSHFFIADLTGENSGVLLETGIAMSLKPNNQIILITQDNLNTLHFDINVNRVINYNSEKGIVEITKAFMDAKNNFELDKEKYIKKMRESLSMEAISFLLNYASIYQDQEKAKKNPGFYFVSPNEKSLMENPMIPPYIKNNFKNDIVILVRTIFNELLEKKLIWHDFNIKELNKALIQSSWAYHLTNMAWLIVQDLMPTFTDEYCNTKKSL